MMAINNKSWIGTSLGTKKKDEEEKQGFNLTQQNSKNKAVDTKAAPKNTKSTAAQSSGAASASKATANASSGTSAKAPFNFKEAQTERARYEKSIRDFKDRTLPTQDRVKALGNLQGEAPWKPIKLQQSEDGYIKPSDAFKTTDANWQSVNRRAQGIFARMAQINPDETVKPFHYDTEEEYRSAYNTKKAEYEKLKKEYDALAPMVEHWAWERATLSDKQRTPEYYEELANNDPKKQSYLEGVHQKLYMKESKLIEDANFLVDSTGYANIVETVFNKGKSLMKSKDIENFPDDIGRILMMTEDERQTYNYYFSRGDYETAAKYLETLEVRLNDAWGAYKANAYMNNPEHSDFAKATHTIGTNVVAGVKDFGTSVKQVVKTVGFLNILPEQRQVYEAEADALAAGSSTPVRFVAQTGRSVGNMLPSIVLNAVAPVSGIFAQTISAGGQNYRAERLKGTSHEKASIYGVGTSVVTLFTEALFNGVSALGTGAVTRVFGDKADDLLTNVVKNVAKNPKTQARIKTILELAGDSSSEMLEELFEAEADTLMRNMLFDENGSLNPLSRDKLEQGLQGALASLALNMLGVHRTHAANISEFKELAQNKAVEDAVKVSMAAPGAAALSDTYQKSQYDKALQDSIDDFLSPLYGTRTDFKYAKKLGGDAMAYSNLEADITLPPSTKLTLTFSGTVQVDKPLSADAEKAARFVKNKLGVNVGYAQRYIKGKKDTGYGGHWDPNTNTMYFNPDITAQDMLFGIVMHESTHPTESTEAYKQLSEYVLNRKYGGEDTAEYKNALAEKQRNYQAKIVNRVFTQQEARAELVAEQIAEILSYSDSKVRSIVDADYTFGQRVLDWIKETVHYWSVKFGGNVEAKRALNDFRTVERYFEKAVREAKGNVHAESGAQYEIITLPDGRKYVQADRKPIAEKDIALLSDEIERRINGEIRHGRNVKLVAEDGEVLFITSDTAWKAGSRKIGNKKSGEAILMPEEKYRTKINAELHVNEIA